MLGRSILKLVWYTYDRGGPLVLRAKHVEMLSTCMMVKGGEVIW